MSTSPIPTNDSALVAANDDLLIDLARLRLLGDKVARVHGATHSEMGDFAAAAGRITDTVAAQVARQTDGDSTACADEAAAIQADILQLRNLSNTFTPWPGSCASVYLLMKGWSEASVQLSTLTTIR